jgi:hypothetical protein
MLAGRRLPQAVAVISHGSRQAGEAQKKEGRGSCDRASKLLAFARELSIRPLATPENCLAAAVSLFGEISERHGKSVAKKIFCALGAPTKKQRKKLADLNLWTSYELLNSHGRRMGVTKAARAIRKIHPGEYHSDKAVEKALERLKKRPPVI